MIGKWFNSSDVDRIKELEAQVESLDKRLFKQTKKNQLMQYRLELFKGFSPKLWFEYFSPDAGKFSHSAQAQKSYDKWLAAEMKRRNGDAAPSA
jgi:hypothetical protein